MCRPWRWLVVAGHSGGLGGETAKHAVFEPKIATTLAEERLSRSRKGRVSLPSYKTRRQNDTPIEFKCTKPDKVEHCC